MKIAIPSDEGKYLSQHFGRTLGFQIYTITDGKITGEEYRPNTFTGHALGQHDHDHHGDEHHDHAQHSHSRIVSALHDCEIVIAGGMGQRLFNDLSMHGKKIFVTSQPETLKAVELFLKNELTSDVESCNHH